MPIRVRLTRGNLLCLLRFPRRDRACGALVSDLALVVSLTSPHLRRLTVYWGRQVVVPDSPQAA